MSEPVILRQRLLTIRDVMLSCRIGRDAAFKVAREAGALKLGRSLRLRVEDLDAYLAKLKAEGQPD